MTPAAIARRLGSLLLLVYPLVVLAVVGIGGSIDGVGRVSMLVPVVINLVLLAGFAGSLRPGATPTIERFARLIDPDLPPDARRHCRQVTAVWCWFFVVNAGLTAALALLAPVAWWALHTGVLAYVAMGVLFAGEFVVRRIRFRRYGRGLHDRLLARVFPPP